MTFGRQLLYTLSKTIGTSHTCPGGVIFIGVRSSLGTILGRFSIIYFRGLWLWLGIGLGLGLVWCYGQRKFRVRVRIRVRVAFWSGL